MEYDKVDIEELNRQHEALIKSIGSYAETKILVDGNSTLADGEEGVDPITSTTLHNCTRDSICYLYVAILGVAKALKQEYPIECSLGEKLLDCSQLGTYRSDSSKED